MKKFDVEITEENIRAAVKKRNELRKAVAVMRRSVLVRLHFIKMNPYAKP